jgi:hypothetical protein
MSFRFHLQRSPFGRGLSLFISTKSDQESKICIADNLVFKTVPNHSILEPLTQLDMNEAQELMDELWHCGIRPTEGAGSACAMRATENHLADLRKITNKLLKIEG